MSEVLEPLAVTLAEAMRLIGVKKTKLNELANAKKIERRHIDGRAVILFDSIKAFVEGLK
jgi:hypothetical protein